MNTVSIMGRVANEFELRKTQAGKSVVNMTVAVDNGWGDSKRTDFFDVVAWNGTAEFISKYFKKGQMIAITGSLQARQWEDKDGNKRKKVEIIAGQVDFCGSRTNSARDQYKDQNKGYEPVKETPDTFEELMDDFPDLPFD